MAHYIFYTFKCVKKNIHSYDTMLKSIKYDILIG